MACYFVITFLGEDWETLQEEHMIRTLALVSYKCLESIPNPIPPPSTQLCHTQAFAHVGEYTLSSRHIRFKHTYSPLLMRPWESFAFSHPLVEIDFPPFIDDFHLETKVTLN
jgi:hypothetical protein